MKLSRIGCRLLVKKFGECFDFYTEKLGFEVLYGDKNGPFVSFKADNEDEPCFSLFLAENQKLYLDYEKPIGTGLTDKAIYIIPTNDIEGDYQNLKDKGVIFIGKPRKVDDWGMYCVHFRDPEGNLLELSQNDTEVYTG